MTTIRDLLSRDLSRRIEEIIQVDQTDEASVYAELTEYVATERIRNQYRDILRAMAEAPQEPHEGVGIWISGFFGSGKSSFAKNLGYVLANPLVLGEPAAELFKARVADRSLAELIDYINSALPTEVIMFDIQKDRAVRDSTTQKITEVMYTVLLRELGYAEDYDIAELEIELEQEGKLEELVARCEAMYRQPWRIVRKGAQKVARASAILHAMDPSTYPSADSWAQSIAGREADITVSRFVERTFELTARRRPGKALVFIIDEVGHYVGHSSEKIEDLRAVVEEFGKQSKNRVRRRQVVAPAWIVVTSQEKLDEVVSALDSRRVELARLQDRFRFRVDLAPADIREVASRRVLAKKPDAGPLLRELFRKHQGQLNAACRLERTSLRTDITEDEFVQFYPYLPHFVDLSIQIMAGIRREPGAPRQFAGSNRTIIKQAYEVLVSDRTRLADRPVGTLVTLDQIYDLVEGNLSSERQKDVTDIERRFRDDPDDSGWALRVGKALALLEFVRDLPRTEANIAAVLIDRMGQGPPIAEVTAALRRLEEAQFVRQTDQGWKLQTAQEKSWDTERRGFLEPKPSARNEIKREILKKMLVDDGHVRTFRYRDLASFSMGVSVDGIRIGDEGRLDVQVITAEDPSELAAKMEQAQQESRQPANAATLYWVFSLTPEIDQLVAELHASREMIAKYAKLKAQQRITEPEKSSLAAEMDRADRLQQRLQGKMAEAIAEGTGFFRGVGREGSALGESVAEVFHRLLESAIPELYPKLEMGSKPLRGTEAEEILKAANLSGLSRVFYEGNEGLGLVVRQGDRFVIDKGAPVAKEVLDYLHHQHSYGNRVTGKDLETKFQGLDYGWGIDVLRTVLAALLRAGAVEVTYGGRRMRDYQDPQARVPFSGVAAFRTASFAPREAVGLQTLTAAARHFEELTGTEVDVEANAIASRLKELAAAELRQLMPLLAEARAHNLPIAEVLSAYQQSLEAVEASDSEECVRILASEGRTLREQRAASRRIRETLERGGLERIQRARLVVEQMGPVLKERSQDGELMRKLDALRNLLASPSLVDELDRIGDLTAAVEDAYHTLYSQIHEERQRRAEQALEELRSRPEWVALPEEVRASVAAPLTSRGCDHLELRPLAVCCERCGATVGQMESDLEALDGLQRRVLVRLQELSAPARRIERVRAARFFPTPLATEEAVDEGVERLREHLYKLVAEGTTIVLE